MTCEARSLDTPDDARSFDHGQIALVDLPGATIARATLQPGWRWSTDVKPTAGTDSCQVGHTGYVVSGRMRVRTDAGDEIDLGPGDAHLVGPGHDAWVVGDEPCVTIDFAGATSSVAADRMNGSPAEGRVVRAADGAVFKASGSNTDGRMEVMVLDVGYLSGPLLHLHEIQEDSFFVLDGVLTLQLGDEVIELEPGDFATAPPGVAHTFTNTRSGTTARMLNIMTPGICFDRYIAALMAGTDEAEMDRLGKEYGVTFVGPSLSSRLGLG